MPLHADECGLRHLPTSLDHVTGSVAEELADHAAMRLWFLSPSKDEALEFLSLAYVDDDWDRKLGLGDHDVHPRLGPVPRRTLPGAHP